LWPGPLGGFDRRFDRFEDRFNGGMFNRFNGGMFNPRFNGGFFAPSITPGFDPGFVRPF
jgi:hypothetical protein